MKNSALHVDERPGSLVWFRRLPTIGAIFLLILLIASAIFSIFSPATFPSSSDARPVAPTDNPKVIVVTSGIEWGDIQAGNTSDAGASSLSAVVAERYARQVSSADKLLHPYAPIGAETQEKLENILQGASLFAYTANTRRSFSCPEDQWLSLNVGGRVYDKNFVVNKTEEESLSPVSTKRCTPTDSSDFGKNSAASEYVYSLISSTAPTRHLGLLGDALAGRKLASIGSPAFMATLTGDGTLNGDIIDVSPGFPGFEDLLPSVIGSHDVTFIDARNPQFYAAPEASPRNAADYLVNTLSAIPDNAQVLVYSAGPGMNYSTLQLGFMYGPGIPAGFAYSPSARHAGLAHQGDITATVISWAGRLTPSLNLPGAALSTVEQNTGAEATEARIDRLADISMRATAIVKKQGVSLIQFTQTSAVVLVLLGIIFVSVRKLPVFLPGAGAFLALWCASIPAALLGISAFPWWDYASPTAASFAGVLGFSFLLALAAFFGPWRTYFFGPALTVGIFTTSYFLLDILQGSQLFLDSPIGYSSIYGARYFGMGNEAYALCATWVLLICALIPALRNGGKHAGLLTGKQRLYSNLFLFVSAGIFVAINGAPQWGADFGGPISFLPGFIVLVLLVNGVTLNIRRALFIFGAGVLASGALAGLDWMRGAEKQTHLGKFVQSVIDGNMWPIIGEKLRYNFSSWGNMSYTIPMIIAIIFLAFIILPRIKNVGSAASEYYSPPVYRYALISITVTLVAGYLLNDSGIIIPSLGFLTASCAYSSALLLEDHRG